MKYNYQTRLIAGLTAMGYTRKPIQPSKKYLTFRRQNSEGTWSILHVGKYGALRSGLSASKSHSIGDPSSQSGFYLRVLAAGDAALAPTPSPSPADTGAGAGAGPDSPES